MGALEGAAEDVADELAERVGGFDLCGADLASCREDWRSAVASQQDADVFYKLEDAYQHRVPFENVVAVAVRILRRRISDIGRRPVPTAVV